MPCGASDLFLQDLKIGILFPVLQIKVTKEWGGHGKNAESLTFTNEQCVIGNKNSLPNF